MSQNSFNTTATATLATGNTIDVVSTANMFSGLPIVFSGNVFGNVVAGAAYYIGNIVPGYPVSTITITSLPGGVDYALANGYGTMTATVTSGGQQLIPTAAPGEPLNQAFNAVNTNFDQIWAAGPVNSNIRISGDTIAILNTNGNLVLHPNGTGMVQANAHVVPDQTNIRNLGSPARRWNTIYTQYIDYQGANISYDNITIPGNLVANGNVTGDYILGNGSQLTGLPISTYGDANVANLLADYGNNNISTTGNITSASYIVSVPTVFANLVPVAGARAIITDANVSPINNFGAQVQGGGEFTMPVWSDGFNWYIG